MTKLFGSSLNLTPQVYPSEEMGRALRRGQRIFAQYAGPSRYTLRNGLQRRVFQRHYSHATGTSYKINQATGWLTVGDEADYLFCQHQPCSFETGGLMRIRGVPSFGVVHIASGVLFPITIDSRDRVVRPYIVSCSSFLTEEGRIEPMVSGWFSRPKSFCCDMQHVDVGTVGNVPYGCGKFENGSVIAFDPPQLTVDE